MTTRATIKQAKQDKLDSIAKSLNEAKSAVFVDYKGMDVAKVSEFRNTLRAVGGRVMVAKNTLIRIAGEKAGYPADALTDSVLEGQTAVVLAEGDDSVSPIQVLGKYVKDNEMPVIKAGVLDKNYYDKAGVLKISTLPSKEQLFANVVGAVAAPMYGLVGTLQGSMSKLVYLLEARKSQLSK